MAVTAKSRARTALIASTNLQASEALAIVKQAAEEAKGGGMSLMTSGVVNAGAKIHVEDEQADRLILSINSGKRLVELCTFAAMTEQDEGATALRVGGLATYKTSQSRLFGLIPMGPAAITGFSLYKRFLDEVATRLHAADPGIHISIEAPEA